MREAQDPSVALVNNLIIDIPKEKRCPHLRLDSLGAYCGKGLQEGRPVSDERRMVCDIYAVQLWCLSSEDCKKCNWYRGEPFNEK